MTVDTAARFLTDLKKIVIMQESFGIDSYPMTPELQHFFKNALPRKQEELKVSEPAPGYSPKRLKKAAVSVPTASSLADVRQQLGDCTRCALHKGRGSILFGRGNEDADLFIVSEYPNIADDAQGSLFSGPDGDLLGKMLNAIDLDLEQVYISSVVKCRASEANLPGKAEVAACLPFLMAQIEAVSPKIICAMGPLAAHVLLKSKQPLIRLRGRWRQLNGIPLMATFHPSYLLKNQEMKKAVWQDLQAIQKRLQ
jgi:DNA polymerase